VLLVVPGQWAQAGGWHQLGADASAGDARTMLLLARKLYSTGTTFSIREVAATLRVTPHAVRAWERRYRLPAPARDAGGERRYTADDVQLLMRISHAATVHGHSLKLASMEAQGLITEEVANVIDPNARPQVPETTIQHAQPWRRIADAFPDVMMLVNWDGVIVDCNVATARAWSALRESFRGTHFTDLVVDYDRAKAVKLYRPPRRRRDAWELRMRSPTREQIVAAFDSRVLAAGDSQLLGLIGRRVAPDGLPA
jgi:DNA-binding transcriptional MerR regulator